MAVYVLDASAIVAYLNGELGGLVVDRLLRDPNSTCYAHVINLCEVYYGSLRTTNIHTARQVITDLFSDGVIERRDMSREFWQNVGQHKARGGISMPDCFCIALAQKLSAQAVTSDHGEFDRLVPLNLCPILFIR